MLPFVLGYHAKATRRRGFGGGCSSVLGRETLSPLLPVFIFFAFAFSFFAFAFSALRAALTSFCGGDACQTGIRTR